MSYLGNSSQEFKFSRTPTEQTATAGQTVFSANYKVGMAEFYRNGSRLGGDDVVATNGTSFTLAEPCAAGDLVVCVPNTEFLTNGNLPLSGGTMAGAVNLFSGSTAPTPAQFDNDTSLATTEFVQRALGNRSKYLRVSANANLTAADAGAVVLASAAGTLNVTLPPSSSVPAGTVITILTGAVNAVNVLGAGSDTIAGPLALEGTTSFQLAIKSGCSFIRGDGAFWHATDGAGSSYLASSGYQKLPSGLIIQWGAATVPADTSMTVTYPLAFPTTTLATFATLGSGLNGTYEYGIGISPSGTPKTSAIITVTSNQAAVSLGCNWLAIGY